MPDPTPTPAPAITPTGTPAIPATPPTPPATPPPAAAPTPPAPETPKPGEAAPPAPAPTKVVPEKYDLKLADGSLLDPAVIEKTAAFAKERGLSNEDAQAILDSENASVAAYVEAQKAQLKTQVEAWATEAQADKEIGGEAFKANAELAKRVVEKFGSESFRKTLDETGLGNHPELIRVFAKIGKMMAEDKLVAPGLPAAGKRDPIANFYPETIKKEK